MVVARAGDFFRLCMCADAANICAFRFAFAGSLFSPVRPLSSSWGHGLVERIVKPRVQLYDGPLPLLLCLLLHRYIVVCCTLTHSPSSVEILISDAAVGHTCAPVTPSFFKPFYLAFWAWGGFSEHYHRLTSAPVSPGTTASLCTTCLPAKSTRNDDMPCKSWRQVLTNVVWR